MKARPISVTVVLAALAAALAAGCTSAHPVGQTSTSGTASAPSTFATADGAPTSAVAEPPAAAPVPSAAPAICATSACRTIASENLGGGYTILLRGTVDAAGNVSVVELTDRGVPTFWSTAPGESPAELDCIVATAMRNCVVVDYTGAHAASAAVWLLEAGTLRHGAPVTSDTPAVHGLDLNGDRLVDVAALQNDEQPNYAQGRVYWQTFTSDGTTLTSTGCGPLAASAPPEPSAPLTGNCTG